MDTQEIWRYSTELRYFMAVAENGSLSAASQRLFVAVSAISRQIQRLEEHVGVKLFERHARGMQLTDAGRVLRQHELKNQQQLRQALAEMHGLNEAGKGRIRIASSEGVAFKLLPRLMELHREKHPGTIFHVDIYSAEEIPPRITHDEYDVGLQFSLDSRKDANVLATFAAPILALMREDHPLADQEISLVQLKKWPMILPDENSTIRQLFNLSCRMRNIHIEPTLVCGAFATQYNAISEFPNAIGLCSQQTLMNTSSQDGLIIKEINGFDLQKRVLHIRANNNGWQNQSLINAFIELSKREIERVS